ncbi:MAG: hypothetical protein VB042_02870 [Victivallaceae bacterium]|nr:hypothetical protein [Victivallaceae bacterium]
MNLWKDAEICYQDSFSQKIAANVGSQARQLPKERPIDTPHTEPPHIPAGWSIAGESSTPNAEWFRDNLGFHISSPTKAFRICGPRQMALNGDHRIELRLQNIAAGKAVATVAIGAY